MNDLDHSVFKVAVKRRQQLHREPETAGNEDQTAKQVVKWLKTLKPHDILIGLGGNGVAAVFKGREKGPRVLIRCELDALPIGESLETDYTSNRPGAGHKCGHDGHMAIVLTLAKLLHDQPVKRGEVVLLFQPAEETGQGASRVLDDPNFKKIDPDYVFALHNLPGFEKGSIIVRDKHFAAASVGFEVKLKGATSHAAEPEQGNSPALAMATLINSFYAIPQRFASLGEAVKVTVIHARLGEIAFGTTPGEGEVMATLRTYRNQTMKRIKKRAAQLARSIAKTYELKVSTDWKEFFPATVNNPDEVERVRKAARKLDLKIVEKEVPFPWSEDFGHFTIHTRGALFGLGSGVSHPALHSPEYDFPDDIIPYGVRMFETIVRDILDN